MTHAVLYKDLYQGEDFVTGPFVSREAALEWALARQKEVGSWDSSYRIPNTEEPLQIEDTEGDLVHEWTVLELCQP